MTGATPLTLPAEGGCRCGALRIRVTGAPLMTSACHCTGCQKMTGSAYALTATFRNEDFALISGEPVAGGLRAPDVRHMHCPDCHSWVYTHGDRLGHITNVRASMFDDTGWFVPFLDANFAERLRWVTATGTHSYDTWPGDDAWPGLIAEYAGSLTVGA